ncbi:hypothetical protein GCM10017783_19020 [Deinococcus piscis]|uniref:IrrE N-terminal-like domain-containing protein n=1 Tax=Deinococcus piscis TaxID=394230 RepID=A0ABQ3K723_9DEIO|nr:ImmA/IrrE family metallo-endopeptidase [Deinococcus piscis]GHG06654.1 hypothetical protein GCM10017783_19020 [Deinococcus piscis]
MNERLLHSLGKDFLDYLHEWHAVTGYLPFQELAAAEDLKVDDTADIEDQYIKPKRLILLNRNQGVRRKRFTGMHEIAHHVFKTSEDGRFVRELERIFPGSLDARREFEEVFVELGGFQLLIPRPTFLEVCANYEDDAKRAQILAIKAGCSLAAAGQRIALDATRPVGGIILDTNGFVSDFFVNQIKKHLRAGRHFVIDDSHPIRQAPFKPNEVEYFKATIPYKFSRKKYARYMQGLYDEKRGQIIVFFNAPHSKKRGYHSLFSDFA